MTTRQSQANRTAKKRPATKKDASPVASAVVAASGSGPAATMLSDKQWDDRRAMRLAQTPAKVMSAVKVHKYDVGQVVNFMPGALTLETSLGLYEIVRHLPPEGPDNQYRVKSVKDGHERVVRESQLAQELAHEQIVQESQLV